MARFITAVAALGLSLASAPVFAHGGGFPHGMPTMPAVPAGTTQVQDLMDRDHHDRDRDKRELVEKEERIKTEIVNLTTRATQLSEIRAKLMVIGGDPREIARLNEELRTIGNRLGMLEKEQKSLT